MTLRRGHHTGSHLKSNVWRHFHHVEWWSVVITQTGLMNSWWVFLAASNHPAAEICEMNTRDISNKFSLFGFVTSIRASCWNAVGARSTKSGRRSMSRCPTTAYCPITPVSMWVSVLTQRSKALCCSKHHWWLVVDGNGWCLAWQDYMLNTPGKEMDLLRVTVKVPGKRPPRAVPACGPPVGLNGRVKDVPGPEGVSPG